MPQICAEFFSIVGHGILISMDFDTWWATTPESKLELIDGKLIISTLAGSRRVAWYLLHDYGPGMALPLAPSGLWWAALGQAFKPQPVPQTPVEWTIWAADFVYDPEPVPAGPYRSAAHQQVFRLLRRNPSVAGDIGLWRDAG